MRTNNVLVLDVETSPILAYVWGIRDQHIGLEQIKEDWHIMAWSAKWLGEKKVTYRDLRSGKPGNDREILKPLWKLLNQADIVVTQNGREFDAKKINARFMLNNMKPPKPFQHYDTYQLVKRVAAFTSNKLEYLTNKFCKKHKKLLHGKYAGWKLWVECLKGNIEAWNEMKRYNIEDVLSTEELYLNIRSWAPETFPKVYPMTDASEKCGTCGYFGQMREGPARRSKAFNYRQHSCPKCGSWQKGTRIKPSEPKQ